MMRLYGVSQMAVLNDNDRVVGIIDEGDILLALTQEDDASLDEPVSEFMTSRLETVPPDAPVDRLLPIFRADRVAIVADEDRAYYGLITKIDFINYLRRRTAWEERPAPVAPTRSNQPS
jgi:cystathionine beta-synthase